MNKQERHLHVKETFPEVYNKLEEMSSQGRGKSFIERVGLKEGITDEEVMDKDIKSKLAEHNLLRCKVVNKEILERTGREVKLSPVTFQDLEVQIK